MDRGSGMGRGPGGPGGPMNFEKPKRERPKNLKEFFKLIGSTIGGFFSRLFYIFALVWETRPWILFAMLGIAVLDGFLPVIKAVVAAEILNILASAFSAAIAGNPYDFSVILTPMIVQFILIFVTSIVSNIRTIVTRMSGELVVNTVNVRIMKKAKTVDIASFDRPEFYEKLENASREAGHRPIQIISSTFSIIGTVISIVSFIVILWGISPVAPFIIAALSLPSAIITLTYRKKGFMYMRFRSKDRRQLSYYSGVLTNKDIVKEVRMFGTADFFTNKYIHTFKSYFAGLKKLILGEGFCNTVVAIISAAVNCGLFLFVAKGVFAGTSEVGDYSLYTGALNSISSGIVSLVASISAIYEGTLFINNLISFMNEPRTVASPKNNALKPERHVGHKIEFCDVSFKYPGTNRYVIKHLTATINPKETIVIVGLNGAGKTTLIKLLTRLYDPTEGKILLDGHDIKEYDIRELYKIFGITFQDYGKYAVTVAENIAMSRINDEIDLEQVKRAAFEASADKYIDSLPNKYDTPLMRIFEENGMELSIGQWQKLSVARAFYSDSDILILDEPTAALDAIAEQEIYNQFDILRRDKTTIFVSHRLSSATIADNILVLESGVLIEQGTHQELMELDGKYAALFSTQAKRYVETETEMQNAKKAK